MCHRKIRNLRQIDMEQILFGSVLAVRLGVNYFTSLNFSFLFSEMSTIIFRSPERIKFTPILQRGLTQCLTHAQYSINAYFLPSFSTSEDLKKNTIFDVCEGYYRTLGD